MLPVTADITYRALYHTTPVTYTVLFRDDTGNVYATDVYYYGETVKVPSDPVKPSTATHSYLFAGWSEPVSGTVEGDATYVALFTEVPLADNKKPGVNTILSPGQDEKPIPVLGISIMAVTVIAVAGCMVYIFTRKRG